MEHPSGEAGVFASASIGRDRDQFLRELLRELSGVLEEMVGLDEAEGFISVVGGRLGSIMDGEYRAVAGVDQLSLDQVGEALVDLKSRINGGFTIESISSSEIVLINDACPFGRYVDGRPSLCMMTSNVFGRLAADNLGYARVDISESFATGDERCRVVVSLVEGGPGREYYG